MKYNPAIHHRRSIRLKGYDYSQAGLYFITIVTQNRARLFGSVENGEMVLNQYGQIAYNEWTKTPEIRNNVELCEFVIMPNHIHGIIRLLDCRGDGSRGELHSHEKPMGVCDTPRQSINSPPRSPSQTIGSIVRGYKSSVTKQFRLLGFDKKLWQRNYWEHIIRNEQSYLKISRYIINNPVNWNNDTLK